jgi:hypothetical protein
MLTPECHANHVTSNGGCLVYISFSLIVPKYFIFQNRWWSPVRDITRYLPEWLFYFCLLAAYLAMTFYLEVPGCPRYGHISLKLHHGSFMD